MENNKVIYEERSGAPDVPYIVYESEMTRMERIAKRLWIITALMALATGLMAIQFYLHFFA